MRKIKKTRMHSSRMHTNRSSSCHGGVSTPHPLGADTPPRAGTPGSRLPWVLAWRPPPQIPLNFSLGCWPGDPPGQIPLKFHLGCGPGDPSRQIPLSFALGVGLETCKACWDTTLHGQNDRHV